MTVANEWSPSSRCLSSSTTSLVSSTTMAWSIIIHLRVYVDEDGNGKPDHSTLVAENLTIVKGTNHSVAIFVELRLRSVPALEYSYDQRHIPLAATNHACHRCWVCSSNLQGREITDRNRLPGAPLWLAAVYSDKFAPVNKYWLPAMW